MTKRAVVEINDYSGIDSSGKSNLSSCVANADSITELLVSSLGFDSCSDFDSICRCYAEDVGDTSMRTSPALAQSLCDGALMFQATAMHL